MVEGSDDEFDEQRAMMRIPSVGFPRLIGRGSEHTAQDDTYGEREEVVGRRTSAIYLPLLLSHDLEVLPLVVFSYLFFFCCRAVSSEWGGAMGFYGVLMGVACHTIGLSRAGWAVCAEVLRFWQEEGGMAALRIREGQKQTKGLWYMSRTPWSYDRSRRLCVKVMKVALFGGVHRFLLYYRLHGGCGNYGPSQRLCALAWCAM